MAPTIATIIIFFLLSLLPASTLPTLHDTLAFPTTGFPTAPGSTTVTTPSTPVPVVAEPGPGAGDGRGAQPVTNPMTAYPPPAGNFPTVSPPTVINGPAAPAQSWCVARAGIPEDVLQDALDYACGIGGADCSQIQQGGSCYTPNTIENHASYAFNSYYQKNPVATSCNFGSAAALVSTNPSSGSCIYLTSSSQSSPSTSTTPVSSSPPTPGATAAPSIQAPTTPVTMPSIDPGNSGSGTAPPLVFNPTNPASGTAVYGSSAIPPNLDSSTATASSHLKFFTGHLALATSTVIVFIAA